MENDLKPDYSELKKEQRIMHIIQHLMVEQAKTTVDYKAEKLTEAGMKNALSKIAAQATVNIMELE